MSEKLKRVAVIDKGGRGHVLAENYAKSSQVETVLAFPGNAYMQETLSKPVHTFPDISTTEITQIITVCKKFGVSLVDVAQDNGVAVGLVNALVEAGIEVVGPTQEAGQIEWDKSWSREFMQRHHIPQPQFKTFHSISDGVTFLRQQPNQSWFVKASGLAEGKGALQAESNQEAIERISELQKFGDAGETYLLEEWVRGVNGKKAEEFSAFALSDGQAFQIIGYAQDHKRAFDHDEGENTGGMGAISPPGIIDRKISLQVEDTFERTLHGLRSEGRPYKGILFLGGMLDAQNSLQIVEFNARWGDPEAQVLIPGIENDFLELSEAVTHEEIHSLNLNTDHKVRVVIAGTAKGYPENYSSVKGKKIIGLESARKVEHVSVYGGGIKKVGKEDWVVDGGRVLYIVGEGRDIVEARGRAYQAMNLIQIEENNLHFRSDIGWQDVARLTLAAASL